MTRETKIRPLVAAPLLALSTFPARAAILPPSPAARVMPHISVTVVGRGSPVILIPGLSTPRAVWDGVTPALARSHAVYLVQVNGFAGEAPGANLSPGILPGVVADLHVMIAAQGLRAPAVVGHSMGGLIGLMLARAHPEDVGRLMVVDALPFYGALFGPQATPAALEPQARAMRDGYAAQIGHPDQLAKGAEAAAAQLTATPAAHAKVATWAAAADPRVSGEAMYEDLTTDFRPEMPRIATPITLVYADRGMGGSVYRAAYAAAPNVRFVPVADAAHFVMLDQPVAFAGALDDFLR